METRRWTNPSQPITLFAATWLLYLGAGYSVILAILDRSFYQLFAAACLVTAGYLVANARSIGWFVGVVTASTMVVAPFASLVANFADNVRPGMLIGVALPLVTFAALMHPASRDFQRTWFG